MIQKIMKKIEDTTNEKLYLLRQLKMWAEAKQQGIDTDKVLVFGFDPELVPEEELQKLRQNQGFNKSNPYGWETREVHGTLTTTPQLYNYVRMQNGDKIPLKSAIQKP